MGMCDGSDTAHYPPAVSAISIEANPLMADMERGDLKNEIRGQLTILNIELQPNGTMPLVMSEGLNEFFQRNWLLMARPVIALSPLQPDGGCSQTLYVPFYLKMTLRGMIIFAFRIPEDFRNMFPKPAMLNGWIFFSERLQKI